MFPGQQPADLERISSFPHRIVDIPTEWIPMSDGVMLASRIWQPESAVRTPVPAVVEIIPYRRRDGRRVDDEQIHPFFAGNGIAGVRVDLRGSGDSGGFLRDEYLKQEQDDAIETIAWIAAQPWCNGCIGMMGLSWGGFAALQVAARRPPGLRAIISVGATVDRYNDDVHFKNGCLLNENFGWASSLLAFSTRPPDPEIVGPGWREAWLERLDALPFFAEPWLGHQLRDEYWRHGSVCEDYAAIEVPVMIVSGWADLYVNAVPRLLENLRVPCRALVGPWAHQYPHLATPGPAVDFLGEAVAWWNRWLRPDPDPAPAERTYLAFVPDGPISALEVRSGRWVESNCWSLRRGQTVALYLTPEGLRSARTNAPRLAIRSPVDTGVQFGELIPHCIGPELPQDQQIDDGSSLVFDTAPLEEPPEIWGDPSLELSLESDQPGGNVVVRLCDVSPCGSSSLVTYGMLNLEHRLGNDRLVPNPVGQPQRNTIRLDHVAHRFSAGNRVRLAISTACWPLVWPAPANAKLALSREPACLVLPAVDPARLLSGAPRQPCAPMPPSTTTDRAPASRRDVIRQLGRRSTALMIEDDYGQIAFSDGLLSGGVKRERYDIDWDDPLSAQAEIRWTQIVGRGGWSVRTETVTRLACDASAFHLAAEVEAFEGNRKVWGRDWTSAVPRLKGE